MDARHLPVRHGPIEPPPSRWDLPHPSTADESGIVGHRGRPRAGHGAGRVPRRACSPCRCAGRGRWRGGRPTRGACCRSTGCGSAARCARSCARFEIRVDTAFDRVIDACADPKRPHGWIDDVDQRGLPPPQPAGLGPQRRGVDAGRRAGRRPLRRGDRRAVRRRVDVPPRHRRIEGGAGRPGRAAGRAAAPRCSTCSGRPSTSRSLGAVDVSRPLYLELLADALARPLPAAFGG